MFFFRGLVGGGGQVGGGEVGGGGQVGGRSMGGQGGCERNVGGRGWCGVGGCEPRIEGIVQCTKRYCTILRKLKKMWGEGEGQYLNPKHSQCI